MQLEALCNIDKIQLNYLSTFKKSLCLGHTLHCNGYRKRMMYSVDKKQSNRKACTN
jgi:hypothetical protein